MNSIAFFKQHLLFWSVVLLISGCSENSSTLILGTLERDRILLRSPVSETVVEVMVKEGEIVDKGQLLLRLDSRKQKASLLAAEAEVRRAEAYLKELSNGARPEDVAAARAQVANQKALWLEAEKNYERTRTLVKKNMLTEADLDAALAKRDSLEASVENVREKLTLLLNGTREETLEQAEASLEKAQALLSLEQQKLDEFSIIASRRGWLDSLPAKQGDKLMAGNPVAIILADEAPYARVYIPEPVRSRVLVGTTVTVKIDGVEDSFSGVVRQVSMDPAFTPHYALNERERSRLVYLAEIQLPESAIKIPAGLPLQVELPL